MNKIDCFAQLTARTVEIKEPYYFASGVSCLQYLRKKLVEGQELPFSLAEILCYMLVAHPDRIVQIGERLSSEGMLKFYLSYQEQELIVRIGYSIDECEVFIVPYGQLHTSQFETKYGLFRLQDFRSLYDSKTKTEKTLLWSAAQEAAHYVQSLHSGVTLDSVHIYQKDKEITFDIDLAASEDDWSNKRIAALFRRLDKRTKYLETHISRATDCLDYFLWFRSAKQTVSFDGRTLSVFARLTYEMIPQTEYWEGIGYYLLRHKSLTTDNSRYPSAELFSWAKEWGIKGYSKDVLSARILQSIYSLSSLDCINALDS